MTDRELLELAAKAAGMRVGFEPNTVERGRYDLYWSHCHHQLIWHNKTAGSEYPEPVYWNPLNNDGDALRLAVKLRMQIDILDRSIYAVAMGSVRVCELDRADPQAATRRAIVRAAAEIGRAMK